MMRAAKISKIGLVFALPSITLAMGHAVQAADIAAIPIPQQADAQAVPAFIGKRAHPKRIKASPIPQNPWMGEDPWNNAHNDSYMSDTYPVAGPRGISPKVLSTWLGNPVDPQGIVVVMTFDAQGLLIAAAIRSNSAEQSAHVQITLLDPKTLSTLATFDLPRETLVGPGFRPAGAYMYLDNQNRVVVGTKDRTVWVLSHAHDAATGSWSFHHDLTYDLTQAIPEGDALQALQPDFFGRVWFTSKAGVVGTLNMKTGAVRHTAELRQGGERIVNSHATDEEGAAYIASTQAMYRFDADSRGRPQVTWREPYDAGTRVKPGQTDIGTGTTPTLMGKNYVTISDNADPRMHVLVFQRRKTVSGSRLVCAEPVFQPGMGSNENSLIATDTSIIVENNYGYTNPRTATVGGLTTTPGIARIDLNKKGGCRTVWSNESISIPSVISKMSVRNGLIYTYSKPQGPGTTDPWYFTAIDFRTGKLAYQQLAGTGILYNNHYAGAYLGPDGTLYVGVLGGIVAMRDTSSKLKHGHQHNDDDDDDSE